MKTQGKSNPLWRYWRAGADSACVHVFGVVYTGTGTCTGIGIGVWYCVLWEGLPSCGVVGPCNGLKESFRF